MKSIKSDNAEIKESWEYYDQICANKMDSLGEMKNS